MAKIVLGMGASPSPQLNAPVEQWQAKGLVGRNDPRVGDYDTMIKHTAGRMAPEITWTGCDCAFARWIVSP